MPRRPLHVDPSMLAGLVGMLTREQHHDFLAKYIPSLTAERRHDALAMFSPTVSPAELGAFVSGAPPSIAHVDALLDILKRLPCQPGTR